MRINKRLHRLEKLYPLFVALLVLLPIQQSAAAYNIGPDDVLRISVYGYEDLKTETRVSDNGHITFPMVGELDVGGKSSMGVAKLIAKRLSDGGFIQGAQVSVKVLEHVSQQVSVLGYVNNPGRYPLGANNTIIDLIAMAGGVNEKGGNKVVLSRSIDGKIQKQILNLQDYLGASESIAPFKMQQGDVVYVPKAPLFYVYGEVQQPGGYPLESKISVVKALSIAGGLTLRGSENRIIIKRKDKNGELQEFDAELGDTVLKDDVIYVKERWF